MNVHKIQYRGQIRKYGQRISPAGDKEPGAWVYGGIYPGDGAYTVIYGTERGVDSDLNRYIVYSDTVCRWSGLVDDQKTHIFDTDVLQLAQVIGGAMRVERAAVKYVDGAFTLRYKDGTWDYLNIIKNPSKVKACKVIGNLFDQPYLMGEED